MKFRGFFTLFYWSPGISLLLGLFPGILPKLVFRFICGFHHNRQTDWWDSSLDYKEGFSIIVAGYSFDGIPDVFTKSAGSERAVGLGSWQRQRRASFCLGIIRMQVLLPAPPRRFVCGFVLNMTEFHWNPWYLSGKSVSISPKFAIPNDRSLKMRLQFLPSALLLPSPFPIWIKRRS